MIVGGLRLLIASQAAGCSATLVVSILFALFQHENLDAIRQTSVQRLPRWMLSSRQSENKQVREISRTNLTPASLGSVRTTHLTSDLLTIAALWAMNYPQKEKRNDK